MSLWGFEPPLT